MSWYSVKLTIDSWHSEKDIRLPLRYYNAGCAEYDQEWKAGRQAL